MHVPAATWSTSGSGATAFFSTWIARLEGTKAARSWLPNALFGTSTALMSYERCGARAGHGLPVSAGSGGRPPVTAGSVKVEAGAARSGSGCRFAVRPGRTRMMPQAP